MKTMTAGKFKAQCLKAGLPKEDFLGCLVGIIEIVGDIESPVQPTEDWNALR
jgi:hypothetical protein